MSELVRGAVRLHYRQTGRGKALVLIHGNSCNLEFFAPQEACFRASHTVVAIDLRGHGASGAPERDYSVHGLAEDVAWMCGELGIGQAVLAGHSLGGAVAVQVAARHPELAVAVAALDSALAPASGRPSRMTYLLNILRGPDYLAGIRHYFDGAFEAYDDPVKKRWIMEQIERTPQHVMVALFEHFNRFDGPSALRAMQCPLLYVTAARPRGDLDRLHEVALQLVTGQTVGSGHFMTLMVPDQVNAMLGRFLEMAGWT